jgi:hypothetical protein
LPGCKTAKANTGINNIKKVAKERERKKKKHVDENSDQRAQSSVLYVLW